ncbi:hypothetical protein STEG23_002770 [Scotinomys teguina]
MRKTRCSSYRTEKEEVKKEVFVLSNLLPTTEYELEFYKNASQCIRSFRRLLEKGLQQVNILLDLVLDPAWGLLKYCPV